MFGQDLLKDFGGAEREIVRRKMLNFAKYMKPNYSVNWHHELICKKLDQFIRGEIKRLMIFVPPQHGKSELTSRLFPAFLLGHKPDAKVVLASYSATMAESFNRDCQKYIDCEEYAAIFPQTKLQPVGIAGKYIRNTERFDIVGRMGFLKTVGVGGSLTGTPADFAIIDDPVKDAVEAQSPVIQLRNWQWYTDVLQTRLHNGSGILVIQTRWDVEDLSGKLIKAMEEEVGDSWTIVNIPSIKENDDNPEDPREIGQALWPEMHSLEKLRMVQKQSLRTFQSLYQQNPQPVQVGGECYKMFDYNSIVGDYKYDEDLPIHVTFDFNVNPYMSCGVWQVHKEIIGSKTFYKSLKIAEICLKSPRNTTKDVCTARTEYL